MGELVSNCDLLQPQLEEHINEVLLTAKKAPDEAAKLGLGKGGPIC